MIEAIIILGKGIEANETIPSLVRHELDYAIRLCGQQPIQAVICSGGNFEATTMCQYLQPHLPATIRLIAEDQSKDTIGNLLYTKALLDEQRWRNLLILASVDHLPRIQYIAEHVFGHDYELSYHGHQHSYTLPQYLQLMHYERLAQWYARWLFYRLGHHPNTAWQQYHFMYHPTLTHAILNHMKTSPILMVIIGFAVIGIIILGVIGIMGWMVLSNSFTQRTDLICGGATGLTCPDGYACVYTDEEGIIDPTGVCVVE